MGIRLNTTFRVTVLVAALTAAVILSSCGGSGSGASHDSDVGSDTTTAGDNGASILTGPGATTTSIDAHEHDSADSGPGATTTVERKSLVVIDPGHNGNNWRHTSEIDQPVDAGGFTKACNTTGTAAEDLTESAFNLSVAQHLASSLAKRGFDVLLTRTDDDGWGPCIDKRGQMAATAKADLLVSIHADGSAAAGHGFHVISPSVVPGYTDSTTAPSRTAAVAVRDALVRAGFHPSDYTGVDGLIQRGDLGTLNRAGVPAIMIEAGNMKNAGDLELFRSEENRGRLAAAIADGVVQYLQNR